MKTGTNHFLSEEAARRYYLAYYGKGDVDAVVADKHEKGEIKIGQPFCPVGHTLSVCEGRYFINEPAEPVVELAVTTFTLSLPTGCLEGYEYGVQGRDSEMNALFHALMRLPGCVKGCYMYGGESLDFEGVKLEDAVTSVQRMLRRYPPRTQHNIHLRHLDGRNLLEVFAYDSETGREYGVKLELTDLVENPILLHLAALADQMDRTLWQEKEDRK